MLRPKPEEIPAERHPSGWIVFHSAEEERIDPVESVEEQRERIAWPKMAPRIRTP